MNKFFSKAVKLIRKLKTWWHRSLYGYKKEDSFTNTINYYYPTREGFYYTVKPKWWGKVIVWLANRQRFTKALVILGALITALLTFIPTWAPVIPEKVNSMISSFFSQTDKPKEKSIGQEANATQK